MKFTANYYCEAMFVRRRWTWPGLVLGLASWLKACEPEALAGTCCGAAS
jgi:hypothetical protein